MRARSTNQKKNLTIGEHSDSVVAQWQGIEMVEGEWVRILTN